MPPQSNQFIGLSPVVPGKVPVTPPSSFSGYYQSPQLPFFQSLGPMSVKGKQVNFDISRRRSANSISSLHRAAVIVKQANKPVMICQAKMANDVKEEVAKASEPENEIRKRVKTIKSMFGCMGDGEINISAYDTAWLALLEDINGSGAPQFPSCLEWIVNHQLPDGSWGDDKIYLAYDRLINTLACVIALKSNNIHRDKCDKGMSFFKENISELENENDEHMPIGFEVTFPSLIEVARSLGIEVPENSRALQNIYEKRNLKLTRISKDIMHNTPTTLLYSLEGIPDLDWEKLIKLQSQDGSFFGSLSSTAYAFMQTKDENSLKYLTKVVQRFNGGVPCVYPVDLFERLWAVDRLQRLGISRYFQPEIKDCMDYVRRYWTEEGISWARNIQVYDIDDTSMGFRLLRLHGYKVSADVFQDFEKGGEFFCVAGQSTQAVTGIFNLYRASQVLFPGEKILENAKQFSYNFLREKQTANRLLDKWVVTKNLPGEVALALDVPWYASLPRVETRLYIEQYGGEDDVWIGKTLYRMPYVSNNVYLELAKLDYNNCQAIHQTEWISMQKWYTKSKLEIFGTSRRDLLLAYFLALASIDEPERWQERIVWAKTAVLVETITSYFHNQNYSSEQRKAFVDEFRSCAKTNESSDSTKIGKEFTGTLLGTMISLSFDTLNEQGQEISHQLLPAWEKWLTEWQSEGDGHKGEAELLVQTIILSSGRWLSGELFSHPQYGQLLDLTNTICHKLGHCKKPKVHSNGNYKAINIDNIRRFEIESEMQELVRLVLQKSSDGIDSYVKATCLAVARSFYYTTYIDSETKDFHIDKVLFERTN